MLDSIAHVFRFRDHGDTKYDSYDASRSQAFFKIASILKRYADEYNIAVLVTNQVVDAIDDGGGATGESDRPGCAGLTLETSGRKVYPALGLAWASCVTTRLFVTKETAMCEETRGARSVVVEGAGGAASAMAAVVAVEGAAARAEAAGRKTRSLGRHSGCSDSPY